MLLIYNANIHTLDSHNPKASALVIDQGRIVAIDRDAQLLDALSTKLEKWDAEGRTVIPGLTDAHIHLEKYALGLAKVDCETITRNACLERVALRSARLSPDEWLLGHGWNQNNWPESFGSASDLDAIAPHHPVYLTAKSLHAAWVNSHALRLAGIDAEIADPSGGYIGRDEAGNPNGILFESAMELVSSIIPRPNGAQIVDAIREAMPILWRHGITGVHDFDQRDCFAALQQLHAQGELKLRVVKSIPLEDLGHAIAIGLRTGFGDDYLRIGCIKAFADGALGSHTAAMIEPYEDDPNNRGILMLDGEELYEHARLAIENGLSLAVHAIGDRANHQVLNCFSQIRDDEKTLGVSHRHRIEHVQIIHPDDAGRLAQLGVIASMQPIHAASDMLMADQYWGDRAAHSYAWRTQLSHGATLAFGSDAPVESPNPFWGLYTALTRRRRDGTPGIEGWYREQRLDMTQALHAYTTGPAYAAGMENKLGKLANSYLADLLVLEVDPFNADPEEIRDLQPVATMVGGEWVHQK